MCNWFTCFILQLSVSHLLVVCMEVCAYVQDTAPVLKGGVGKDAKTVSVNLAIAESGMYMSLYASTCTAECVPGCVNGECIAPDKCFCDTDYKGALCNEG